ncbi:serine/threonine-protein kinase-like protein ccr2 [Quercus suber]|uniref:non-specific serine/threonine protein kinase n=1 Tax=Quercus suber TaxID=58331 RepID=A0AAW0KM52_QUESU
MPIHICLSGSPIWLLLLLLLPSMPLTASGYGSPGPVAAAFGDINGFFCAIDAGGNQEIICWDRSNKSSSSSTSLYSTSLPPMATLSGGEGFMCGITSNTSKAYCWNLLSSSNNLLPQSFQYITYSQIAAGKNHVCAIRGSYYSSIDFGTVHCWEFHNNSLANDGFVYNYNSSFLDPHISGLVMRYIVSGEGFSCGLVREGGGGVVCWGPNSIKLGTPSISKDFDVLASGRGSVCGISNVSKEVECWGQANDFGTPPIGTSFVGLSAGAQHYCGVHKDDHGVECWGRLNSSLVPKSSGFMSIASSDYTICGVREVDLVLDCWSVQGQLPLAYSPPLQLCSPGVCSLGLCGAGKFSFNASVLNEPDLISLCVRKDLKICLPCGTNCSQGYFPSSVCSNTADRICTACSLCQNRTCWDICGLPPPSGVQEQERQEMNKLVIIIGCLVSGTLLVLFGWCLIPRMIKTKDEERGKFKCTFCVGKPVVEADPDLSLQLSHSISTCVRLAQAARGLEYLHKEVTPPIVHRDVKTSNILLDPGWGARIADFGILSATDRDLNGDMESDVYNFGIVLLEILSGRKAYDRDCSPPCIVQWALPLIRLGKAASIIDRSVALLRDVEPLLKLADVAELALRENPTKRPTMPKLVVHLIILRTLATIVRTNHWKHNDLAISSIVYTGTTNGRIFRNV